jgi:3-dehydrosphinganine reductase
MACGNSTETGSITDVDAGKLKSCTGNNYFTAAYAAQSILKVWKEDDKKAETSSPRLRQIVFINSAAALLGIPGYAAHTCKLGAPRRKYQVV